MQKTIEKMVEISYLKTFCKIVGITKNLCYYSIRLKLKQKKNELVTTTHTFIKLSHRLISY